MNKITLCGATHGSNFGDTVFGMMFYEYLSERYPEIEFRFTELSDYSKRYIKAEEADKEFLKSSDAIIFISGGFFGESQNENLRGNIKRYIKYFRFGKYFMKENKSICISGVGAGPINNKFLRKIAVEIFDYAKSVSVRDNESRNYMIDYGVHNDIKVTTDSAISISNFNIFNNIKELGNDNSKSILLHISEAIDYNFYKEKVLVPLVKYLPKENTIIISNDVEGNKEILEKVSELFKDYKTIIYEYSSPNNFLSLLHEVDAVITPKLHVGIFASTFSKSVISFPLHPEKTLRYYEQIGYPENTKSIFEVTDSDVKNMIINNLNKPLIINEKLKDKSYYNFELMDLFILNTVRRKR